MHKFLHYFTISKKKGVFVWLKEVLKNCSICCDLSAVAASVPILLQYKIYHKELDKDFREFEDEEDDEDDTVQEDTYLDPRKLNRNYISLNSSKR